VRALKAFLDDDFGGYQALKIVVSCGAALVIAAELSFSLIMEIQFCYVLPDRNFLSSKSNSLQIVTILQKFVMQMLALIYRSDSDTGAWVISVLGLIFSSIRAHHYHQILPLYHFKALLLQASLLWTMLCLNLAFFGNAVLRSAHYEGNGLNFIVSTWIVLSILAQKVSSELLKRTIFGLLSAGNSVGSPELLIHKAISAKEFLMQEAVPGQMTNKYDFTYLLSKNLSMKVKEIFGLKKIANGSLNLSSDMVKRIYLLYCEDLLARFPQSTLIRLHLAKISFKNKEAYPITVKIASGIERKKWSRYFLSSALLLHEIEKSIVLTHLEVDTEGGNLDMFTFVQNKLITEKLKKEIIKQANFYSKVCDNILGDVSDLGEIYDCAQLIGKSKDSIQKISNKLFSNLPDYYVSPFLIYAEYHLILNYSITKFNKYVEAFTQKFYKNHQLFSDSKLVQQNLYQDNNAFLLLSSQNHDIGKILFSTKSLQNLCGNTSHGYTGLRISSLFPPTIRAHYDEIFRTQTETLINKTHRGFLYNRNNYLTEVDFCLKYHPYLNQNLCLGMIIRPVPLMKEFLLLREDGSIEGSSREISHLLAFPEVSSASTSINIKSISEELFKLSKAFNIVQKNIISRSKRSPTYLCKVSVKGKEDAPLPSYPDIDSSKLNKQQTEAMTYHDAMEIYSDFTSGNQRIILFPYETQQSKQPGLKYHCDLTPFSQGKFRMTYIALERVTLEMENQTRRSRLFQQKKPPQNVPGRIYESKLFSSSEGVPASENVLAAEERRPFQGVTSLQLQEPVMSPLSSSRTKTDTPMLSLLSERRNFRGDSLVTSFDQDASPTKAEKDIFKPLKFELALSFSEQKGTAGAEHHDHARLGAKKYVSSQGSFQDSAEKAANKAYKAAIHSKSYPRSFRILCLLFYGVILLTLVGQIIMKFASNSTLSDLETKKELLKSSQERSYRAILAQNNAYSGAFQISGALSANSVVGGMDTVANNLKTHAKAMKTANRDMIQKAYALDKEAQDGLFTPNIKMYGTYLDSDSTNYEVVTSFQATEKLINSVEAFNLLDNYVTTEGYNNLNFISENVLNDYQYQNLKITDTFIESIDEKKQSYNSLTIACIILVPFLLIGVGALLAGIIVNQYQIEKRQMGALLKIRYSGMKDVLDRIKKFQRNLINEESFEGNWFQTIDESLHVVNSLQNAKSTAGYSKEHNTRTIKSEKFKRRYYQYIIRVILYISVLVGISIWDWVSTNHSGKVIYHTIDQIQYANYISNRVIVAYVSFVVLFATNNTMPVEHGTALEAVVNGAAEARVIQNQFLETFKDLDGNYDPEIKAIIYNNDPSCSLFTEDRGLSNCEDLVEMGLPTNMMSTITSFESLMSTKKQDFDNADKSSSSTLITALYSYLPDLLPNAIVTTYEAQSIADIADTFLLKKIKETKDNRTVILGIFSLCLLVAGLFIWLHILKQIREVYNDFKKVLQIFPPGLILSSFLLKKFLMEASNQQSTLFR